MIIGDPNCFAILVEKVDIWTAEDSYINGIFHYIIGGYFLPEMVGVATLSGDIFCLSDDNALVAFPESRDLFFMPKEEAFKFMLSSMLPSILEPGKDVDDNFEEDFQYQASTYNIENGGSYVFAVSLGEQVRILGAKVNYLLFDDSGNGRWEVVDSIVVHEVFVNKDTVREIVNSTRKFVLQLK
ncbi:immunity 42 family protein [Aquipseudomonas campi]